MANISWIDRLTNKLVLEKVVAERQRLTTIGRSQRRFVGHDLRRGGIERTILEVENWKSVSEDRD